MKKLLLPALFLSLIGLPACYDTKLIQDQSSDKAITGFQLANQQGVVLDSPEVVVNIGTDSIKVYVPDTLNRNGLIPNITFTGVVLIPNNGQPQNFNNNILYKITAQDGTQKSYVVEFYNN
jgi:hypothetical protein